VVLHDPNVAGLVRTTAWPFISFSTSQEGRASLTEAEYELQ
jgi:hypothetical protein